MLIVAFDKNNVFTYPGQKYDSGIEDATIVTTHMMLCAKSVGVDSCWVNYFDPDKMAETFQLPANEEILTRLAHRYPAEGAKPLALVCLSTGLCRRSGFLGNSRATARHRL
jgi:nitroreductase